MENIGTQEFMQICFVTRDAEKAMKSFQEIFGVERGTLKEIPPPQASKTFYRGKEIETKTRYFVFRMGNLIIELTQPDEADSVWKQVLDEQGEGLCYLGVMVGDSKRAVQFLEAKGNEVVHWGGTPESNYNVVDTRASLGCMLNVKMQKQG